MKRLAFSFVILLVAAVAAAATDDTQARPRPIGGLSFVDEYELTVVNIVASVTDKKGEPVTDLTVEDFRVVQDGELQRITNFQLYTEEVYRRYSDALQGARSQQSEPPTRQQEPTLDPEPVSMVIYVDNQNLHPLDRNRVLNEVRGFVLRTLRPPVRMMVVSEHRGLKILQPFTSDPQPILEALRGLRTVSGGRIHRDSSRQDVIDRMMREIERQGSVSGFNALAGHAYSEVISFAEEESHNLAFTMDRLREVVTYLSGLPGRKSILYISNGLPIVPGLDLFNAYSDTIRDPTVLTETQRYDRSSSFRSLINQANSLDVTFHTIGAGGLEMPGMSREARASRDPAVTAPGRDNQLAGLRLIARDTGGLAIVKTNDFEEGLERIEQDIYTYYSIGYAHTPSGQDKMHRLEVSLPNHPDLEVRSRSRFVEKSLETRVQERVLASLLYEIDDNPMGLELRLGAAAPASPERWSVPLNISIPIDMVALLPEGGDFVGNVVLFAAARELEGESSGTVRDEFELRVPADAYETARGTSFAVSTNLLMTPGTYRLAIGVVDLVTRQASYRTKMMSLSP